MPKQIKTEPDLTLVQKTKRRLKEVFYGKKTYLGEDFSPKSAGYRQLKLGENRATKSYIDKLREAGATPQDIAKFMGKKI